MCVASLPAHPQPPLSRLVVLSRRYTHLGSRWRAHRYGIKIEYTFPDSQECMDLVREKGMFSFYEDGHQECCRVRKVRASSLTLTGTCNVPPRWWTR